MRLHLGCGNRYIPGFVHVDIMPGDHIDYVADVSNLWMFDSNEAELIYACHVLEYFDQHEVVDVLAHWRSILKPNGICRVSVPDFDKLVALYGFTNNIRHMLGPLYGRIPNIDGNIYHRCVYNEAYLIDRFEAAGYSSVRRWDWRNTEHSEVDDFSRAMFPHMDFEKGVAMSLNLEGIR